MWWLLAEEGWEKLNFDGAMWGNPREARFGYIIKDSVGMYIRVIHGFVGETINNETKMEVLSRDLKLCR